MSTRSRRRFEPLAALLGDAGPTKIVHDVAFDARLLAESGVALGNVHDTAIAARMLGRAATGLASLASSELGIALDKSLQHHDWRERPLGEAQLAYLAADVLHLAALEAKLWTEVRARGIEDEVLEETRYRVARAIEAARQDTDAARAIAYAGMKGFGELGAVERAVLRRRVARARGRGAAPRRAAGEDRRERSPRRDRPKKPRAPRELAAMRLSRRGEEMGRAILDAIARGIEDGAIPDDERARVEHPRPPREVVARSRAREKALTAWRKETAKAREVDEQVVLPGHCLKELAESDASDAESVARVPGFGACRLPYAEAIAAALARAVVAPEGAA